MSGGETILEVEEVSYAYGQRRALDGVSLRIAAGCIYALLGPNGAGKSTLIGTVCGRKRPSAGRVRVAGGDPMRSAQARRAIGLVPQEIALFTHLTVRENLTVFGHLAGLRRAALRQAVADALGRTALEERSGQIVASLSGGYKRRANIAAALLHAPMLLVLDEPTVGIDVEARNAINAFLRDLAADGAAILMTTHDLAQAESVADEVGLLRAGELVDSGKPSDLVRARFGHDRELVVVFAHHPTAQACSLLEGAGLWREANADVWHGRLRRDAPGPEELADELDRAGAHIREIRLREPGLESLYADMMAESA